MNERALFKHRILAYKFAMLETGMYLDTHPNDEKALALFALYRAKLADLIKEYECRFGPFIDTMDDVEDCNRWTWIDNPWPWDYARED